MKRLALPVLWLNLLACGAGDNVSTELNPPADGAGVDVPVQDVGNADPCDRVSLASAFETLVAPHVPGCRTCHDMTAPAAILKAPGPQWYHPTDPAATVAYLMDNALIDSRNAAQSLFLLKPLAKADGGVEHLGGDQLSADTPAYDDFRTFLDQAANCN